MADPTVPLMMDKNGDLRPVPPDNVQNSLAQGWKLATPDQIKNYQLQQKYGTPLEKVKTAGEAFARGMTADLSDVVETGLRISTPEAIKGRQEANPATDTTFTLGGAIGSQFLPGVGEAEDANLAARGLEGAAALAKGGEEASTLAKVGQALPSNLISKAGRAAERAAGAAAGTEGPATLAQTIARQAIRKGVGSSVEGALWTAGHELREAALGDPNQTAQSVVAHVGLGALLGGGLGALTGAAEAGIPTAVTRAQDALADIYGAAKGKLGEAYRSALGEKLTGVAGDTASSMLANPEGAAALERAGVDLAHANPATAQVLMEYPQIAAGVAQHTPEIGNATPEMAKWFMDNATELQKMETAFPGTARQLARVEPQTADKILTNWPKIWTDPDARTKVATELGEGTAKVFKEAQAVLRELNQNIMPEEARVLLADANPKLTSEAYHKVADSLTETIDTMRAKPDLYGTSVAAKLEGIRDGLVRDVQDALASPIESFERLRTLKRSLDSFAKYDKAFSGLSYADQEATGLVRDLRGLVKDTLTDESVFGQAAARRAALDEAQANYLALTKKGGAFNKQFMRKVQKKGGVQYEMNPKSVNTWLNQMADARGQTASDIHGQFMEAARNLVNEAEQSFKTAPVGNFDHKSVTDLINRTGDITQDAQERAAITQLKNQLSERGHPWGSNAVASPSSGGGMLGGAAKMLGAGAVLHNPVLAAPLAVGKAIMGAKDVSKTVATLASLERISQKVSRAIDAGVAAAVKGGARASAVSRGEIAAGLSRRLADSPEEKEKQYNKTVAMVTKLAGDPEALTSTMGPLTDALHPHAPDTHAAMSQDLAARVAYMASQAPQKQKRGLLSPKPHNSQAEMSKYLRKAEITFNPGLFPKKLAAGTLMPEHVEAMRATSPHLLAQTQRALIEHMPKDPSKVPYQTRRGISMVMGAPADGSFTPATIRANQAAYAPAKPVKPTQGGLSKLTVSNRLLTPQQESSQRGR